MSKTIRFTISVPAAEFKELEAVRRKAGKTRSLFVREAVRARKDEEERLSAGFPKAPAGVKEGPARYGAPGSSFPGFTDIAELRRRAIAAAGRFRSGVADLSTAHDGYLEHGFAVVEEQGPGSEPDPREKP